MKYIEKAAKALNDAFDACLVILLLAIFMAGAYTVYDNILLNRQADSAQLAKYRPGNGEEKETEEGQQLLSSCIAWLTVEGTKIDFPVMQGENNDEFLNTDPFGRYSLSGSIFLDARNSPEFTDSYSVIYGHHMTSGAMFGALDRFMEEGYLKSHSRGTLAFWDGTEKPFAIIAATEADATDRVFFEPGHAACDKIMERAGARGDAAIGSIQASARLVSLTTCKYPDTTQRIIVLGLFTD